MQSTVKPVFWLAFVSVPVEMFKVVHIKTAVWQLATCKLVQ